MKKIWTVEVKSEKYSGEYERVHVMARNAAEAARKGKHIALQNGNFSNKKAAYCALVHLVGTPDRVA